MTYGIIGGKTTLRRMMEEEELLSKAAGCPVGHTFNKNIQKCIPGSPLSGIPYAKIVKNATNKANSGKKSENSADMAIKQEIMMRQSQGLDQNQ